ncbi:hypothetical protein DFH09DRAFT_1347490 [Mycena vulgaris]|nr:hypothetical protein DFH09DRAFT_1347490 [Mycena vulgaris]
MPATTPNTLIVFGANEDAFFIGHGRRHTFQGVPERFAAQVQGVDLPITQTAWISFDPTGTKYIAKNDNREQFYHSTDISKDLIGRLKTTGFITLGSSDNYFIKHKNGWHARLPPKILNNLQQLKPHVPNFDSVITGLLFGHEQTHIFLFEGGFMADLNAETRNNPEHPLMKVLAEFNEGWCILPGSTLCSYSDRYFFLKFKKPNDTVIQMKWLLPDSMKQKHAELRQLAELPEDQMFLSELRMADMQRQQANNALAMERLKYQAQRSNQLSRTLVESGEAIRRMALAPGTYKEVLKYY